MEAGALFSKSRSEVTYRKDQNSFPKPKVKAKSVIEFNPKISSQNQSLQYHQQSSQQPYNQFPPQFPSQLPLQQHNEGYYNNNNSQYNQFNSRFITNSSSNTSHRAWSDVTYRPYDVHTELTNFSDPGPQVQKQPFNFSPRAPPIATIYENDHNYYLNQQQPSLYDEARSPKPKIAASAMMDIGNNAVQSGTTTIAKSRKVILSAQLNNTDNFTDQDYPDPNDDSDNHKEDYNEEVDNDDDNVPNDDFGSNDNGNDQAEFDELMNMSSDPRIQRKLLDLQISNKSLLALNDKLETTVKEQSDKLAIIPSFETMMETQQKQLEHLNKVKELICTLSAKITDQDDEIKIIKNQIVKKSDEKEKEKTRATLFYDPKSLPLNSLPNIIFDRAYDDITILFSVVTSLLYTVYIFPFVVITKAAKQLVDKSRDRIQEVKIVTNN